METTQSSEMKWPVGDGAAIALVRNHDWSASPLGPSALWSDTLKSAVDLILGCSYPMIVLWGPELVQVYNDAYSQVMGQKHPGGMGQGTRDCWPEVWYINEPIYKRVLAGETLTFVEQMYPIMRFGFREETYFNLCFSPLRDSNTTITGVLVTLFDITRQSTEKLLKEQREAFLMRLHNATEPLSNSDEVIRAAARLLGEQLHADHSICCEFDPDEETFEVVSIGLQPGVHDLASHHKLSELGESTARALRSHVPDVAKEIDGIELSPAGDEQRERIGVRAHIMVPVHRKGRLVAAIGVQQLFPREWSPDEVALVQEVADHCWKSIEKARTEMELRRQWYTFDTVLSHTLDFIYIFDLQGRFTYVNRALLNLWGVCLEEAVGKNFSELNYPPALALRLQDEIQQVIRTKQNLRGETPFSGPGQEERHYEYIFVPVLSGEGKVEMVAGSTRDITDFRKSEETVRASLVERETLLREIHHRVKNNLQVIVSLLGLQSDHISDPTALAAFHDIQGRVRAIARIHEMLYSSVNLARVEFGYYARVLVGDIMSFFNALSERIELVVETEEIVLNIDQAIPLSLILNELMTNAIKHAFPGNRSGKISVSLAYLHDMISDGERLDDATAVLSVRDNGPGVPDTIDVTTTESMGLHLIRVLTRQLHGTIDLERGTRACFRLAFPVTHNNIFRAETDGETNTVSR